MAAHAPKPWIDGYQDGIGLAILDGLFQIAKKLSIVPQTQMQDRQRQCSIGIAGKGFLQTGFGTQPVSRFSEGVTQGCYRDRRASGYIASCLERCDGLR